MREVGGIGVKLLLLIAAAAAVARGGDGFGIVEKCRMSHRQGMLQVSMLSMRLTTIFQQPAVCECENKSGASDLKFEEPPIN